MFAAFAVNISTASVTDNSLVVPEELDIGWNLIDGYSHCSGCPSWAGAGPGTTDNIVPGDSDLEGRKVGEISFKICITAQQFKLMRLG